MKPNIDSRRAVGIGFGAMKTCPACQQSAALNVRDCPHCGHQFIPAITWVSLMAIALFVLMGVLLLGTAR
ncbi:MAG TPA: zinc ribbon domain-containing protein [Candidatus Saccharimonadales bacterium]|nr:zinc ribbon domain-containing protein [Candidatus Saccharimonadales bacterium]